MPTIEQESIAEGILTEQEMEAIVLAIMPELGVAKGVSTDVVLRWVNWCEQTKVNAVILAGILAGEVTVRWDGKKFVFRKA